MCGIAGWVAFDADLTTRTDVIERMTATMTARGPDAGGVWVRRHAALGHLPSAGLPSLPVYPTQLFELSGCVAIFLYLWLVRMKRPRFDGWITIESLGLYAVLRFGLEFIRDDERGIYFGMSTSQWLSIAVLVFCVWLYAKRKPSRAEEQPA